MSQHGGSARAADVQGSPEVVVVSGLPRSGTSMMMSILEAGGITPLTDRLRSADDDNPKGYYEFERVKKLSERDHGWLQEAEGKAVKVIAALLTLLPPDHPYAVVFMNRNMEEILASQRKMLSRNGRPTDKVADDDLARMYRRHLAHVKDWLSAQPHLRWLDVDYNELLRAPGPEIERVAAFLGGRVSVAAMRSVIDPNLYRQRGNADRTEGASVS